MEITSINSNIIKNIESYYRTKTAKIKNMQDRYKLVKDAIPIYNRKFVIDGEEQSDLVNHPVHVDFLGNIVNTKIGYLFGNAVKISIEDETQQQFIDNFVKRTYFDDVLAEVGTFAGVGGYAGLLLYVNKDAEADTMSVDPASCLFIGDDILNPQLAMRFYNSEEINNDKIEVVRYVEIYNEKDVVVYKTVKSTVIDSVNKDTRNDSFQWKISEQSKPHGFNGIPLIAFKNNDNLKGDCENVLDAMDAYDRVLTDELSDVEQYRLDYLVLKGDIGEDPEKAAQKLKKMRIMYLKNSSDGQNNQDAYFITRMMPLDAVNATLDRNKKEIYEIARHLNVADESFGTAPSGVALRNKQLPFEFKCLETEREFKASLTKMFRMLSEFWSLKNSTVNYLDIDYTFTRNYANNKLEEAQFLSTLIPLLPPEIIIPLAALDIDMAEYEQLKNDQETKEVEEIKRKLEEEDAMREEQRQIDEQNSRNNVDETV